MALAVGSASAQDQPSASAESTVGIDPKAVTILRAACAALSDAQTMSFTATDTFQRAARNGQQLYYTVKSEVTMRRPDKLRVIKVGDGVPDEFYYDGKQVVAYVPSENMAATAEAPPTIDEMLNSAWDFAEITFTFSDILLSRPCAVFDNGLKSAFYVGQSKVVGGVTTDMLALATDRAQGEIWIGVDDHLPRMIRVNYPSEPARASYQTDYSDWRIDEAVDTSTFTSERAAGAKRIAFQPPSKAAGPEVETSTGDGQR